MEKLNGRVCYKLTLERLRHGQHRLPEPGADIRIRYATYRETTPGGDASTVDQAGVLWDQGLAFLPFLLFLSSWLPSYSDSAIVV